MSRLIKSYKTEINPTPDQKTKINKTIGTCRYMYNFYIAHNKELYYKGIGIDLGIKDLAVVSNGTKYKNINKSYKVKRLEKQLKRQQRSLSRKYENLKKLKKGEATQKANIRKQMLKVQRLYHRIDNIRTDYINKTILKIVKTKPSYITI